jgi:hypothetical protein
VAVEEVWNATSELAEFFAPLVSCPIYLSLATSRTKRIRLNQVWRPAPMEEPQDALPYRGRNEQLDEAQASRRDGNGTEREEQPGERPALGRAGAGEEHESDHRPLSAGLRCYGEATYLRSFCKSAAGPVAQSIDRTHPTQFTHLFGRLGSGRGTNSLLPPN